MPFPESAPWAPGLIMRKSDLRIPVSMLATRGPCGRPASPLLPCTQHNPGKSGYLQGEMSFWPPIDAHHYSIIDKNTKGAIRTATAFLNDVLDAVESIQPTPPREIASYLTDPEVLRAGDKPMGPGTSTIIAKPTVNIGTISGGVKVNMIPDHCAFELDIRLPNEGQDPGRHTEIKFTKQEAASKPSSFSIIDLPIIDLMKKNAEAPGVGEFRPVMIPSMGATGCKHYRYAGISANVYECSPLIMASVNESASVDEFLHVTKVHALATWDYLTGVS
ncbi:hypothetical protein BDW71DRAFT_212602 [Aspergillus fruticulosus]